MSGHSKWATIKTKKAATDAKRSNVFGKLSKAITVAARNGVDLDMNFKLRLAVDKAKAANMPKDNIEKAIAKGAGNLDGEQIEEIIYEGYGPGGVAILVEATTDNRNRTSSEMKHIFSKNNGSLGSSNSVQWMFEHKGILRINDDQFKDKEEFMLELIDLGAADVAEEQGGLTVYCEFENFEKVKNALEKKNISFAYAEIEWIAKDEVEVDQATKDKLEKMFADLEENEDVTNYFTNAKV